MIIGSMLCSCNGSNNPKEPNEPEELTFAATFNLNEIEDEFETHTEKQLQYMANSFDNLPSLSGENSKPNSLELSWEFDTEETVDKLTLELSESSKMTNPIIYSLDLNATSKSITNLKVGKDYYWRIVANSGEAVARSETSMFSTVDGAPRFIDVPSLSNVRDLGAWETVDGKRVKQGMIYRGEEFNKQNYAKTGSGDNRRIDETKVNLEDEEAERSKDKPYGKKISADGEDVILNQLKLRTEIDVRGYEDFDYENPFSKPIVEITGLTEGENKGVIQGIDYQITPIHTNGTKIYKDSYGKAAVKKFFTTLAKEESYPCYFHCAQGKDRTGFIAIFIEAFLGVSREDCLRDYLLSNFGTTGSVSLSKLTKATDSNPSAAGSDYDYISYLDGFTVSGIDSPVGDTFQERATNYLLSCGITQDQLDSIKNIMLED